MNIDQDIVDLDHLGRLLDDLIVPVLVAWAIYLGKVFLIRLAKKLQLPPEDLPK